MLRDEYEEEDALEQEVVSNQVVDFMQSLSANQVVDSMQSLLADQVAVSAKSLAITLQLLLVSKEMEGEEIHESQDHGFCNLHFVQMF
jgi:hypothetical protein